ncbi:hypothetical protein PWT90_04432 [Aphanocladium album]|nr:hypothetical protein PWT90_04432 [Aphanocladium album]
MASAGLENQIDGLTIGGSDYLAFNSMHSSASKTPRYLFRIFTPLSQGLTNTSWVKSMDAKRKSADYTVDVFERTDKLGTADMIHRHLQWWRGQDDNLVSWTSSLLFALVYIFHLHANESHGCKFQDISLCVIDTRGLPDDVFIRDMDLVAAFREGHKLLQRFEGLRQEYYFGEYLTQGALKIKGRCHIISAQRIIENGLYDIRPEFEGFAHWEVKEKPPWAKPTRELRKRIDCEKSKRQGISRDGLKAVLAIAQLFEAPWRLPMAASLVALAAPRPDDYAILLAFRSSRFTGVSLFFMEIMTPPDANKSDAARRGCCLRDPRFENLHEVNEYLDIMKSIYKDYCLNKFEPQINFARLRAHYAVCAALHPAKTS